MRVYNVCECKPVWIATWMWRPEDNFQELFLSLDGGTQDSNWVIRSDQLAHLIGQDEQFKDTGVENKQRRES